MRCGFLICSRFICQSCGHFQGSLRNFPEIAQSVSPFWTVYSEGASACRSVIEAAGAVACDEARPGTKLAEATTNAIMSFRIAALSLGYGVQNPYAEKGLRPLFHVVR
jgi:hypothetical protein